MQSVQTMRWILVAMSAVAGLIAIALGYWPAGAILLFGVSLHSLHWWATRRQRTA